MKLVRFGPAGQEKPGIIDSTGGIRDLSSVVTDIAGEALTPDGLAKIRNQKIDQLPKVTGNPRLGACVGRVRHYIAIGLNYADHAAEAGQPLPKEPIIFSKAPTSICGPNDDTITPKESTKLDYEIELGIVIGSRARYLEKGKAMEAVAGYFLANDVSERDFQIARSGPIGPWLVTKDEIPDPQALDMWLTVNGETRQKGSTKTMIFGVEHLVWYCSHFFIMEPGDIIATGTPPGVALGMKPQPKFLKAGDVVRLGIEGLGEQQQKIVPSR
jgi:2-keto-4-pentenoate hydratase/2-oxohepta-3-ene-1,7-dioic acid hydratase in catechol pathway